MSAEPAPTVRVSGSVTSDDPSQITRAMEALSRAVAGLALDGIYGVVVVAPDEPEDPFTDADLELDGEEGDE